MTMNLIKVKARENSIGFQLLSNFTPHVLSFFFFLKDNYNMLLTLQLEISPRPPSTLCIGRCQRQRV